VVRGRKMRLDTTVVETNIHYPTDSNLLGDGVRVLTRAMERIFKISRAQGAKFRDRSRSMKFRILEIGRVRSFDSRYSWSREDCYEVKKALIRAIGLNSESGF
jgi:IS5 family transposase